MANKIVNGKQMALCWYVDDIKVSQSLTKEVDDMIKWICMMYECLIEDGSGTMKVCRGKIHQYIGMTLDFTQPGEVKVTMLPYMQEIISEYTKYSNDSKTAVTPVADHLFKIDKDAMKLDKEMGKVFHNFVAKCLFATKKARPDIHTAVAFLTTRVREPDEDDWKKLQCLIRYI